MASNKKHRKILHLSQITHSLPPYLSQPFKLTIVTRIGGKRNRTVNELHSNKHKH
ncbi:hypothetical protein JHK82_013474 [Glycine max]|nr:hypothetical protein JHK87_013400 [Glycine soja]KAG5041367.1 hypothetical protein JHK85_013843 [Glycine max]KAG5058495.1 hypothetical protein JHK86_013491 [Glycine max]KAG5155505.1 hypothetical protein JHK82_013474 [Glycine max]